MIAAVNGACAAGGLELAVACDLIVAAAGATFTDAHSRLGLAPAIGGAAGLVALAGRAPGPAADAARRQLGRGHAGGLRAGRRDRPGAELEARAGELADALARRSPRSLAHMKELVHRAQDPSWAQLVEADIAGFRAQWDSGDLREGIAAYTGHRAPAFGRQAPRPGAGPAASRPPG